MASVLIITHLACLLHLKGYAGSHPEIPQRLEVITNRLGEMDDLSWSDAILISRDHLLLAHAPHYVDQLLSYETLEHFENIDTDTIIGPGTIRSARFAAGALIQAVDKVMEDQYKRVFCAVRPPGHHAENTRAMGFCFFNNVAIGALYAKQKYGLERIAIIDFDVHHGNGTQEILAHHDGFLYISSHESPLFPGTGLDSFSDKAINVPMLSRTGSRAFKEIYETKILPQLLDFAPQLIFISAGFDAHQSDPLSGTRLIKNDYKWVTEKIVDVANATCNGKIISTLEGGYHLEALADSVEAHILGLQKGVK